MDPIGGIQQKMVGARDAGATVFLTPAANCPDTARAVPAGLRLIKVSTLAGAVAALDALKAGRPVPGLLSTRRSPRAATCGAVSREP